MDPLWLVPAAVLVVAVPVIAMVLRNLATEVSALRDAMVSFRTSLQPAVVRVRDDSTQLRRRVDTWR